MFTRKKKGQSILEYAVFLAVIVAVIIVMQIYVKRAVQGKFKSNADQIGEQFTTGQAYTVQTVQQSARREIMQTGGDEAVQNSTIQAAADGQWGTRLGAYQNRAGTYTGAELSSTDFTDASGTHSTFDSGKLKDKQLFNDDD